MSFREILKSAIGAERLSKIKGVIWHYGCILNLKLHHVPKLSFNGNFLIKKALLSSNNFHIFRGYYDINYLHKDGRTLLCHRLPLNARNNLDTKCDIGYYDLKSGEYVKIADTSAWCWQQGSRLRWHPLKDSQIIFNSVADGHYCTEIYDTINKDCIKVIDWPLYDVTNDFKWGISLNFSRLQRLRPGYGYNYLADETEEMNAPEKDGIILIDIQNNESRLLYSLHDLAKKVDPESSCQHYVNHISISPSGQNFIFFHIYARDNEEGWNTVLYVSDIQGKSLIALEHTDRCSHYCWIDNENIIITCRQDSGQEYYCTYNITTKIKEIIHIDGLNIDGHPIKAYNNKMFLTDTYPQKNSLQKIQTFSLGEKQTQVIAKIYHDYRLRGEKRCDLHPSISLDILSVDTTYMNKRRSILLFQLLGGHLNG